VRVVVREGAVALSGVGRLDAGDMGRLHAEGGATVERGVDVDALLGWLEGGLAFEDVPLGQVLQDLQRWYGVDVRLADSALASLPFTGSLSGLPPRAAVELVGATLGLRVRRDADALSLERVAGRTPHGSPLPGRRAARPSSRSTAPP
jgi:transmembrane sensor